MPTAAEVRKSVQTTIGVTPDTIFGDRETWPALRALAVAPANSEWPPSDKTDQTDEIIDSGEKVDARSEKNIATLHPKVQPFARALIRQAVAQGLNFKITGGTRTYAEQNALYAQGRTKPGKRVTNAKGGYSNHNFEIAFDCTLFKGTEPVWDSPNYKALGVIGKSIGLEWGGSWTSFKDEPHFQLRPAWATGSESSMLAELRKRKASGKDAFA